jgi:rare lipoprotein A
MDDIMALDGTIVLASYYGYESGSVTANGERYNPEGFTAAHRQLPFNTFIVAENLDNGRYAVLRVNDRGPSRRLHRRGIDVSLGVARELGMIERGLAPLRLRVIGTPGMMAQGRPSGED